MTLGLNKLDPSNEEVMKSLGFYSPEQSLEQIKSVQAPRRTFSVLSNVLSNGRVLTVLFPLFH